ncbi:MAG: hypothetical protein QHH15_06645 [Candidatus Thermoplasmatota archaeon]|jgi:hypothetical protein|nr:hypothetical protein [Candidatus Thermoplasmatota archaeon]
MLTKIRKIKSIFIFSILLLSFLISINSPLIKAIDLYNAKIVLGVDWDLQETKKPIIPRDEIKELNLSVIFKIETGDYFGKGLLIGYAGSNTALINIMVFETSPWCHAVLDRTLVETNISKYEEAKVKLFLLLDETAPAFGDGYIKINVSCGDLGLLKGFEGTFTLTFTPSYLPIIKVDLPQANSKRISPDENAVFPIKIENKGNARTAVFLEIEDISEGWSATVSEKIILDEETGSKSTAYLTVIPPKDFGYHYENAIVKVKLTPSQAENPSQMGKPLYATFIVQNRGFSSNGIEQIFLLGLIIIVIFTVIFYIKKLGLKFKKDL